MAKDLDFLAARLHGRRSRMYEGDGLDSLCRLASLEELFRAVFPESEINGPSDFQRRLVQGLVQEVWRFEAYTSGPGAALLHWTLVRFQVENLRVLIRAWFSKPPAGRIDGYLLSLPAELGLDTQKLSAAESLADFVRFMPGGPLQESLERTLKVYPDYRRPFLYEAALDRGYFQGLLTGLERLPAQDRDLVRPLVQQEADIFHLMVVTRGRFHYGLAQDMLRSLCVEGTRIPRPLFSAMLNDPDVMVVAGRLVGRVIDADPFQGGPAEGSITAGAAILEGLAWRRFLRLANATFRRSHMGLAAVFGYTGLRRIEVANLITICEGIRSGMAAETIRGRLIPRPYPEGVRV
jgi:vacuolar-type H+-ATPase subunit C/Vma6